MQFQSLNNGVERKICEVHSVFLKPGIFVKEMQLYFKRKKTCWVLKEEDCLVVITCGTQTFTKEAKGALDSPVALSLSTSVGLC